MIKYFRCFYTINYNKFETDKKGLQFSQASLYLIRYLTPSLIDVYAKSFISLYIFIKKHVCVMLLLLYIKQKLNKLKQCQYHIWSLCNHASRWHCIRWSRLLHLKKMSKNLLIDDFLFLCNIIPLSWWRFKNYFKKSQIIFLVLKDKVTFPIF